MRATHKFCVIGLGLLTTACTPTPSNVAEATSPLVIYPDYQDVTLPCNIAPLNFMTRDDEVDAIAVTVSGKSDEDILSLNSRGNKVIWDADRWQSFMSTHIGDTLNVTVTARTPEGWQRYPSFTWVVSPDSLDSYLTYRLIEPGYEVWDNVVIEERCTENFSTRLLADGHELGNRCMNCHTHGGRNGEHSFFHLRGQNGGTILCRNGKLRKLTLRNQAMTSGAVYGDFHPSGRYAVFSNNVIIPAFHTQANRRLEVYDTTGDLCVADFDNNRLSNHATASELMSFPTFSADGAWIYYCAAPNPCGDTIPTARDLLDKINELHYSLYRMPFDAATGQMHPELRETIYDAQQLGGSANLPKCSPDGKHIIFCISDNGTFPIWHRETRLCLWSEDEGLLKTDINGTYHSWSHNSKWLAFASKREDGQYGRAYFVHIDDMLSTPASPTGRPKPIVLPQSDPEHDDMNLRSYNIPDLSRIVMPFENKDIKLMLNGVTAETFE